MNRRAATVVLLVTAALSAQACGSSSQGLSAEKGKEFQSRAAAYKTEMQGIASKLGDCTKPGAIEKGGIAGVGNCLKGYLNQAGEATTRIATYTRDTAKAAGEKCKVALNGFSAAVARNATLFRTAAKQAGGGIEGLKAIGATLGGAEAQGAANSLATALTSIKKDCAGS